MTAQIIYPDVQYLRACFDFDEKAGILYWKARPREHFESEASSEIWHARFPGTKAGARERKGYLSVSLKIDGVKKALKVHRVVWIMQTGSSPKKAIDHINGVKDDNRLENLREAGDSENMRNRPVRRDNKVGVKGVIRVLRKSGPDKFTASIKSRHGALIHLGTFETADDAQAAYVAAAVREHREFAHVG